MDNLPHMKTSRVVSLIASAVALASLALPWATLWLSAAGQRLQSPGLTLWDLARGEALLGTYSQAYPILGQMFASLRVGIVVILLGAALVGTGAIIGLFRPAGGVVTLGGAVLAFAGTLASTTSLSYLWVTLSMGLSPDAGAEAALAAGILGTVAYFMERQEPEKGGAAPALSMPFGALGNPNPPPPAAPRAPEKFCPTCGKRWGPAFSHCPTDGTELKVVA